MILTIMCRLLNHVLMVITELSLLMVKQGQVRPIPLLEELKDIMIEVLYPELSHIFSMKYQRETPHHTRLVN